MQKVITRFETRFTNNKDFEVFLKLESLLLSAANKQDYKESLQFVLNFYDDDFNEEKLKSQLELFGHLFDKNDLTFLDIFSHFQEMGPGMRSLYSEIITIIELILIIGASNATSERGFSTLKRIKTYCYSTMGQARLNHLMTASIHREEMNELNLIDILNEFASANEQRKFRYGRFIESDFN